MEKFTQYNERCKNENEAQKRANELAEYLTEHTGGNWIAEVWENLGWHYSASCGTITAYWSLHGKQYSVLISDKIGTNHAGAGIWHTETNADNPLESLEIGLSKAKEVAISIMAAIQHNEDLLTKMNIR